MVIIYLRCYKIRLVLRMETGKGKQKHCHLYLLCVTKTHILLSTWGPEVRDDRVIQASAAQTSFEL
jgi:hypothetical protein